MDKMSIGADRRLVGRLQPGQPVQMNIEYDDIDLVDKLQLKLWSRCGKTLVRDIDVAKSVELAIYGDNLDAAREIDARIYTVHAVLKNGGDRLITKGQVWLTDTN